MGCAHRSAAAAQAQGYTEQFQQLKGDVLGRIVASPDLVVHDRKRVAKLVSDEFAAMTLGASGVESLSEISNSSSSVVSHRPVR